MMKQDELIEMINNASKVYIDTEALLRTDRLKGLVTAMVCHDMENRLIVTGRAYGEVYEALNNKKTEKQAEEALTLMTLCSDLFSFEKEELTEEPAVDAGVSNVLLRYWDTENKLVITGSEENKQQLSILNTMDLFKDYPVRIVNLDAENS